MGKTVKIKIQKQVGKHSRKRNYKVKRRGARKRGLSLGTAGDLGAWDHIGNLFICPVGKAKGFGPGKAYSLSLQNIKASSEGGGLEKGMREKATPDGKTEVVMRSSRQGAAKEMKTLDRTGSAYLSLIPVGHST